MPRPFTDISKWEQGGCNLYEPLYWKAGEEKKWILERFEKHFKVMHTFSMKLI